MSHRISFSPEARADLFGLYNYIAEQSGTARALGYIKRIETWCQGLSEFPMRGAARDDLRAGLRIMGFERRATIAFTVKAETVTILRVLYGGRDLTAMFSDDAEGSC